MPPFAPIKRRDLIQALRRAGFEGPFPGGRHEFMVKGTLRLVLPNPLKAKLAKICWRASCVRQVLTARPGKTFDRLIRLARPCLQCIFE